MIETESASLIEFLRRQRQTRNFTDEPLREEQVEAILEVMRWTGSASNSQPWQFVVVRDQALRAEVAKGTPYTAWLGDAPIVILVLTESGQPSEHAYDEGRVSERILLAAQALGLGAGIGSFDPPESQQFIKQTLGIPAHLSVYSAVAVGYAVPRTTPLRTGTRKPLSALVHSDRYRPAGS